MTRTRKVQRGLRLLHRDGPITIANIFQTKFRKRVVKAIQGKGGVEVMSRDWDNLIILDACRYDVFKQVADLPGDLLRVASQGSNTREFIKTNFEGRQLLDTVCVTGNPWYGRRSEMLSFHKTTYVWKTQSEADRVTPPEAVVRQAKRVRSEYPNKRLICHFMQPHVPFFSRRGEPLPEDSSLRNYRRIAQSDIPPDEVRSRYKDTLRYTLESVGELLDSLRGKTVVTADHGEFLGERFPDFYHHLHPNPPHRQHLDNEIHDYGHCSSMRSEALVSVPWLKFTQGGRRDVTRGKPEQKEQIEHSELTDRLEALGYR